jgi:hypothetical protein
MFDGSLFLPALPLLILSSGCHPLHFLQPKLHAQATTVPSLNTTADE